MAMAEQGLPKHFDDTEVSIMMNACSGNVFLTNSEYQTAMMNGKTLEMWHFLPHSGEEGFLEDLEESYNDLRTEDREHLEYYMKRT